MYNLRQQQSALDAMEVLRRNGIRVIIPKEQVCCGSPLIRTGQLEYVDTLKQRNIEDLQIKGYRHHPHHVRRLRFHTQERLQGKAVQGHRPHELLTQTGIEPPAKLNVKATYHDPCHLLRGQGVRDQPRALVRQVVDLVEMPAICCGAAEGSGPVTRRRRLLSEAAWR